ncbi:MAG: hypothetical protein IT215_02305 [Chitinophagaceae bacterium]|nr:hypothetical protein [Chitinophagaceae bacterium]
MRTQEANMLIDKLSYYQLVLSTEIKKAVFDDFIENNHSKINAFNLYSSFLNIFHYVNDEKWLAEDTVNSMCEFLHYPQMNFEELKTVLTNRATKHEKKLSYSEAKKVMQCIFFLSSNYPVPVIKLHSFKFLFPAISSMAENGLSLID